MGKREKHREKLPRLRFVHQENHMKWPRRELGTPAVGGERLTACSTELPFLCYLSSSNVGFTCTGNYKTKCLYEKRDTTGQNTGQKHKDGPPQYVDRRMLGQPLETTHYRT